LVNVSLTDSLIGSAKSANGPELNVFFKVLVVFTTALPTALVTAVVVLAAAFETAFTAFVAVFLTLFTALAITFVAVVNELVALLLPKVVFPFEFILLDETIDYDNDFDFYHDQFNYDDS
jgi:hypothetical protein